MSISYINLQNKKAKPKVELCLPNLDHTTIGVLNDTYNMKIDFNRGALNLMTFDAPLMVERNHKMVENPFIKKFNGYYHVRVEYEGKIEYFVYTSGNKSYNNDGHSVSYTLYSLGYLLNNKMEREYSEESKTLSQHVNNLLAKTDWRLDYCDVTFDLMYRTFEVSENTVLECMYQLAEKYGAIIRFDSVNQTVNFHKYENLGINKGLKLKEGLLLESYSAEYNYDAIVTRMYVYGQDGLEFRRLSPTGSNYIESLDWFMIPFECDANYNVIKSSKYMSDDLCIAIKKYEAKLQSYNGQFENLTTNKTNLEDSLTNIEQELSVLDSELRALENERWVINKTLNDMLGENELSQIQNGTDVYPSNVIQQYGNNLANVVSRLDNKKYQIDNKNSQIGNTESQITNIENQINNLREVLKVENNYTSNQLKEMNKFIIEKSYTNDSISDEKDLLADGIEAFKSVNKPPIKLSVSLPNFLHDVKFEKIKDRIALGDIVTLKSEDMDIHVQARIVTISYDFSSQTFNLTISNEKDLHDEYTSMRDKIYNSANTSTTVNIDKTKWSEGIGSNTRIDEILNSEYDAAKNAILAGYQDLTTIDRFGIRSLEYNNSDTFLFINNAILGITNDNLNSIEVAISKNGVHANKLVGKLILSNKVVVEDALGVIELHSGLQTIYDASGRPRVYLGRYPDPDSSGSFKYGLRIVDGAFDIRTSSSSRSGIQIDGLGIRAFNNNQVRTFDVDAVTGVVSIIGSMNIKSNPNSQRGIEIDSSGFRIYNESGLLMFNADHFGNIYYRGRLDGAYGTVSDLGGTLQNMGGSYIGSINSDGTFRGLTTGTLSAQTVSAININADQITSGKISANLIDTNSLTAATITAEQISSGTFNSNVVNTIQLNADQLTAGNIDGDTIGITGRMNIYGGIRMHSGGNYSGIYFPTTHIFESTGSELIIGNRVNIGAFTKFNGRVDFTGCDVLGLNI